MHRDWAMKKKEMRYVYVHERTDRITIQKRKEGKNGETEPHLALKCFHEKSS